MTALNQSTPCHLDEQHIAFVRRSGHRCCHAGNSLLEILEWVEQFVIEKAHLDVGFDFVLRIAVQVILGFAVAIHELPTVSRLGPIVDRGLEFVELAAALVLVPALVVAFAVGALFVFVIDAIDTLFDLRTRFCRDDPMAQGTSAPGF